MMSFTGSGVTFRGGIKVNGSMVQKAPGGAVIASYDARTNGLLISHSISDDNGIVESPNASGQKKLIHYVVEYALTNPYNPRQIAGWRPLGQLEEGMNTVPQAWANQQIRVNGVFRDGLGKTETVLGNPFKLPPTLAGGSGSVTPPSGPSKPIPPNHPPAAPPTTTPIANPPSTTPVTGSRFSITKLADATEGQAAVFQLERTGLIRDIATVQVETMNESARMGADYVGKVENIFFDAGETKKLVHISTLLDTQSEGTETFFVSLRSYNPIHGIVTGQHSARASIANLDPLTGQASKPPTVVAATSGQDRLQGTIGADLFQMAASPTINVNTFRADQIVAFNPEQGDKIQLSRSAYRLKTGPISLAQVKGMAEQQTAFNKQTTFVYDQLSGMVNINPLATIDGSEGAILQLMNKPLLNNLSGVIQVI